MAYNLECKNNLEYWANNWPAELTSELLEAMANTTGLLEAAPEALANAASCSNSGELLTWSEYMNGGLSAKGEEQENEW